jgi:hypothetical protein
MIYKDRLASFKLHNIESSEKQLLRPLPCILTLICKPMMLLSFNLEPNSPVDRYVPNVRSDKRSSCVEELSKLLRGSYLIYGSPFKPNCNLSHIWG